MDPTDNTIEIDRIKTGKEIIETEKVKPKKLGLYKEGKTWVDKVVKETFKPDEKKEKKSKKVIELEPDINDIPDIEEEPGGGVFEPVIVDKGAIKS